MLSTQHFCCVLPDFAASGLLPPGIHHATWDEVVSRFGGTKQRARLLAGLKSALDELKIAGCARAYLNGSFVTAKERPGDFDLCYEPRGVDPMLLSPVFFDFTANRAAQKTRYGGELFPVNVQAVTGYNYLQFFQQSSDTGEAKGIVALDIQRLP